MSLISVVRVAICGVACAPEFLLRRLPRKLSLGLVLGTLGMFPSAGNPFLLMFFVSDISLVDAFPSVSGGLPSVQTCNLGMIFPTPPALGSGPTSFPVMPDTVAGACALARCLPGAF